MIICKLQGGLGNQLFQYAFAKSLSIEKGFPVKFDIRFYQEKQSKNVTPRSLDIIELLGNIEIAGPDDYREMFGFLPQLKLSIAQLAAKFKIRILSNYYLELNHFQYDAPFETLNDGTYLEGYWQHYKYFERHNHTIFQSLYTLLDASTPPGNANELAVHIRRGDYIANNYHPVLSLDYYSKALDAITEKLQTNPNILVFSDDINWCKKSLKSLKGFQNAIFVENGYHIDQFKRMALCTHFIIANSTFSWWAAWLASRKNGLVIAPSVWVKDQKFEDFKFFPENWIIL